MRTSIQKGDFQAKIAKSHKDFMKAIKEDYNINEEAAILIAEKDIEGLKKKVTKVESLTES